MKCISNIVVGLMIAVACYTMIAGQAGDYHEEAPPVIKFQYLGQSSFLVTTSGGTTFLTDPIDFKGYHMPPGTTADIVTVSHEHIDHNCVDAVSGSPAVFRGTNEKCTAVNTIDTTINDVRLYTVPSFHNPGHSRLNAIFIFEFDGIRLAHPGDLGTTLTDEQVDAIGEIDILMVPLGGQYTISTVQADSIVEQLHVKHIVIGMHFKTEAFDDLPYTAEPFMEGKETARWFKDNFFIYNPSEPPPAREYIVMGY